MQYTEKTVASVASAKAYREICDLPIVLSTSNSRQNSARLPSVQDSCVRVQMTVYCAIKVCSCVL